MTESILSKARSFLATIPALAIFGYQARALDFIQDDSYITYRFVANYLNGDGLVYNIGERIEGFTNFGWTIYLLLLGVSGLDFIWLSRVTGFAFGLGVILLAGMIVRELLSDKQSWYAIAAIYLVAVSQSLVYWAPAGLETAAFAFFATWSLLLYLRRSWLLIFALTMAVWIRPEGAMVTGLLIGLEAFQTRRLPRFTLISAMIALGLSVPFVIFKLSYYGSILPNPFYAKTSFTMDQLSSGVEYMTRFLGHYQAYIPGLLIPGFLAVRRKLSPGLQAVWIFVLVYLAYILFVGGDVLKVHRFFLPLFAPLAVLSVLSLEGLTARLKPASRLLILFVAMLVLLPAVYMGPKQFVDRYRNSEVSFTEKMLFKAQEMKRTDSTDFSVAVATIGIFGYELLGHELIDLVGLTDSTIARYSEDPIPGMETTWKEQKHNSRYLLERAPDYILFSTGIKPSAPAERALLLYRQFMDSYRTVGWYFRNPRSTRGVISSAFKKVRPITGEIVPVYPVEYVQEYKKALDAHTTSDHETAIKHYDLAARASPKPYHVYLIYQKAFSLMMLGQYGRAQQMMNNLLVRDSMIFEPHADLYRFAALQGDTAKMTVHRRWLQKLVPWYWRRIDSTTQIVLQKARQQSKQP